MTSAESKPNYENAILQQLIKNAERLAVIEFETKTMKTQVNKIDILEQKVDYIYKSLKWVFGLLGAILIAVIANLLSQPILSWLS
ncbi:hypothetical protein [Myxosarcina sp. GI1]|uniref:hypothetical protein n=1 Tax=Myxosarcina sp. GI1 TaxID=1541065 RepID=UPI00055C4B91|nr:hypothetical protein [Myxosarcina sp. GI1]